MPGEGVLPYSAQLKQGRVIALVNMFAQTEGNLHEGIDDHGGEEDLGKTGQIVVCRNWFRAMDALPPTHAAKEVSGDVQLAQ